MHMQMQRLFTEMDDSERLLPLQIGLDPTGTGSAFVARNLVSASVFYPCCSSCLIHGTAYGTAYGYGTCIRHFAFQLYQMIVGRHGRL